MRLLLPVFGSLAIFALMMSSSARGQQLDDFGPRQIVLETPRFVFYSHFGFNLYDAVLTSATARLRKQPDPVHEGSCFAALAQEERSAWDAAVSYYAETVAATDDFSRDRTVIRSALTGIEVSALKDDERRDLRLSFLFLQAAGPAWRACRWPDQDAANRRWIADLQPRLARHAEEVESRLETLFADPWRGPITVDVVATSGWSGADTITYSKPTHTQITSRHPGYQGPAALEMIFHEASHEMVSPRNGPIAQLLASASQETGVPIPPNLWHGLLFVTVGEVVRDVLARSGEGAYRPFAEDVFGGSWQPLRQPLVEEWLPFVRGERSREEAARRLMTAFKAKP